MNKHFSKKIFLKNDIRTPNYFFLSQNEYSFGNIKFKIKKNNLKLPIVIKPNDEGSSIGVKICKNFSALKSQFNYLSKRYTNLLFEKSG